MVNGLQLKLDVSHWPPKWLVLLAALDGTCNLLPRQNSMNIFLRLLQGIWKNPKTIWKYNVNNTYSMKGSHSIWAFSSYHPWCTSHEWHELWLLVRVVDRFLYLMNLSCQESYARRSCGNGSLEWLGLAEPTEGVAWPNWLLVWGLLSTMHEC